nr:GerAB/ArcD/ProY family transporter [Maliibacterium massiliense]
MDRQLIAQRARGLARVNRTARAYNKVSRAQVIATIVGSGVGIAYFILPAILVGTMGTGAWAGVLASGGLSLLSGALCVGLLRVSKAQNFSQASVQALGKVGGNIASALVSLFFVVRSALSVYLFVQVISGLMLPRTPPWVIAVLLAALMAFIMSRGLQAIMRINAVSMVFLVLSLLLLFSAWPSMKLSNILPLWPFALQGQEHLLPLLLYVASGPELMLVLQPHMRQKEQAQRASATGVLGIVIANLAVIFCALAVFGPYAPAHYTWPTVTLYKLHSFLGLDRPELLVLIVFIVIAMKPSFNFGIAAVDNIADQFRIQKKRGRVLLCLGVAAAMVALSASVRDASSVLGLMRVTGISFGVCALGVPLVIYIALVVKTRTRRKKEGV